MSVEIEVRASRERVWEVVSNPNNLPRWDRHVARVEGVPPGGLEVGTRYTTELRFMGARGHVQAHVVELRPPEYARVRLHGFVDAEVETTLEALDGDRTTLRHRIEYRFLAGPLGELASRAVQMLGGQALLRRGAEAQKRQAEDG